MGIYFGVAKIKKKTYGGGGGLKFLGFFLGGGVNGKCWLSA